MADVQTETDISVLQKLILDIGLIFIHNSLRQSFMPFCSPIYGWLFIGRFPLLPVVGTLKISKESWPSGNPSFLAYAKRGPHQKYYLAIYNKKMSTVCLLGHDFGTAKKPPASIPYTMKNFL